MIKLSYDPSYLGSEGADKYLNFASTTGKTPTISPLLHVLHTAYVSLATLVHCIQDGGTTWQLPQSGAHTYVFLMY